MQLKIKKLHPDAIIPQYQTDGAACFDLHAITDFQTVFVCSEVAKTFRTGLAFEVPVGQVLLIFSRSGHGFRNDTRLANCVGVIDSDYRGEVQVRLKCDGMSYLEVKQGDRIAQAMLVQVPRVELVEVEELSDTARGASGFGSTGS
jgi:dUTP pyrophosphatase